MLIRAPGGIKGEFIVPEWITQIGSRAFKHCYGLTNVVIPDSVTTIGSCAFEGCFDDRNVVILDD